MTNPSQKTGPQHTPPQIAGYGGSPRLSILIDFLAVVVMIIGLALAFLALSSSPIILGFLVLTGLIVLAGITVLWAAHWPSITPRNHGFVLKRRRLFRGNFAEEEILPDSIAQVSFRKPPMSSKGEKPLLIVHLEDGRRFRFSLEQLGPEAYQALAEMVRISR